jgi:hypothetical protein
MKKLPQFGDAFKMTPMWASSSELALEPHRIKDPAPLH